MFDKTPPYEVTVAPSANSSVILHLDLPGQTTQVSLLPPSMLRSPCTKVVVCGQAQPLEGYVSTRKLSLSRSPRPRCSVELCLPYVPMMRADLPKMILVCDQGEVCFNEGGNVNTSREAYGLQKTLVWSSVCEAGMNCISKPDASISNGSCAIQPVGSTKPSIPSWYCCSRAMRWVLNGSTYSAK